MRKILVISNVTSGLYNFRYELIQRLVQEFEVFIMANDNGRADEFTKLGCTFIETGFDRHSINPVKEVKLFSMYIKLIRNVRPDIVLTYTIKPNIYAGMVCALLGIPYIANITGLGTAVEKGGIIQKIAIILYKIGLRRAQMVFFQNSENRDFMLNHGIIKGAYGTIPGSGVNLQKYKPLEYPNGETTDFVFIGRIMKEKGIDQYIDAAKYIRGKYPQTRFHICGAFEENYGEQMKEFQDSGIILYHGVVKDMISLYQIASCTIHPSYYPEGLSNVLLESCACARPIITTNRAGCREVVDDGVNGFICKQKDSEDLIKQIEKFIALPYEKKKQMGLAGRAKVEKKFDRNIVVEAYLKEIERILNISPKSRARDTY
jgi:galacturonosyltransferase